MSEEIGRVECRQRRYLWIGVIELTLLGFGMASLPFLPDGRGEYPDIHRNQTAPLAWSATFALLSLLCVAALVLYILRARIVANESGLHWRDVRHEKFARWDEVTDFYVDESSTRKAVIETTQGRIDAAGFNNQEALRAFVQSHATNSASREWTARNVAKTTALHIYSYFRLN